ncbi:hypothetical protein ACTFIV_010517 [Dictyostelium citrinum]
MQNVEKYKNYILNGIIKQTTMTFPDPSFQKPDSPDHPQHIDLDNPQQILHYHTAPFKKWHKLATLEYIKKVKELKIVSVKDHNNFKDPKILFTSTTKLRKTTANHYCIPESSRPNIISFDQFI